MVKKLIQFKFLSYQWTPTTRLAGSPPFGQSARLIMLELGRWLLQSNYWQFLSGGGLNQMATTGN